MADQFFIPLPVSADEKECANDDKDGAGSLQHPIQLAKAAKSYIRAEA